MVERPTLAVGVCVLAGLLLACTTARPPAATAASRPAAAAPASAAPTRPEPPSQVTGLSFTVEPADAQVVIDGQPAGTVSALGRGGIVPLPPGLYQVTLERTGYATWRAEVAVHAEVQSIRVALTRR